MTHFPYDSPMTHPAAIQVNLGRFISVMKFRPLLWQNTHPYILADRMEDISDPERRRADPNGHPNRLTLSEPTGAYERTAATKSTKRRTPFA